MPLSWFSFKPKMPQWSPGSFRKAPVWVRRPTVRTLESGSGSRSLIQGICELRRTQQPGAAAGGFGYNAPSATRVVRKINGLAIYCQATNDVHQKTKPRCSRRSNLVKGRLPHAQPAHKMSVLAVSGASPPL